MLSDSIRKWNSWWANKDAVAELAGIERSKLPEIKEFLNLRNIKDIIGVRRCGKTSLMYQAIQHFISAGISPKNILFLNFDDNEIYNADFGKLLTECRKINPDISHVFLDEVQEKGGWERWARTLYDTKEFKQIFVSGSSSSLLKSDIGRVLTGRHTTFSLFPFSFKEYLIFHGWKNFEKDFLEYHKGRVLHYLERYIKEGGFPETFGKTELERNKYLNDLFDDIIAKDVAARHKADYDIAKRIAYYAISHSSKTMTHRSIAGACNVSVDTVSKYISFFSECFLVLTLKKYSAKLREQMREINKYYSIDTGLAEAVGFKFSDEFSRLMENAACIELKRRYVDKKTEIFYWRDLQDKEVDFLVKEGLKVAELIQVCYSTDDADTKKRETVSLTNAMEEFNLKKGLIITWDYESEERIGSKKIICKPFWKWLLE